MLTLAQKDFDEICEHALKEYASGECCGILTSSEQGKPLTVHVCENIQNKMHERDPERFPRTNIDAYLIDPAEHNEIMVMAGRSGGDVVGFYHSHVDCDAYFSEEDKIQACALFGDEPTYPEAFYLVVSVLGPRSGKSDPVVSSYKCFLWDDSAGDFNEVDLIIKV